MEYQRYQLRDIGDIVSGATPKTTVAENFGGAIPWLTPADLSGYTQKYISRGKRNLTQLGYDSCSTQIMPSGTVLFSSRAPIGYTAIAKNPICTNQGFKSIVPKPFVNSEFLYYQLIYLRKTIQDMGSGTTFKEISAKKFGAVQVTIPPLVEQEHIISRIEELFSQLDASVAELKTAKERLKVYRQAVL
uniref:restriction endonuclease subunit S n=1 Tax=Oscillibacter sp. CU971 TaxID=2780102 RepID=UPI001958A4FA